MTVLILKLLAAPALVGAATVTARRWGPRPGGVVSAFPAIVGPVLLVGAVEHGAAFAGREATGTLLGLVALSAFALAYAHAARSTGWRVSLLAGWAAAAAVAAPMRGIDADLAPALALAVVSLAVAHRGLRSAPAQARLAAAPGWDLPLRMALTALVVIALTAAASRLGAVTGGMLTALPVLASVLAVFTYRRYGSAALGGLMRGMIEGMAGFVTFCALIAGLAASAGAAVAFTTAALAAIASQALLLAPHPPLPRARLAGRRRQSA
jgi:hypothetical protein